MVEVTLIEASRRAALQEMRRDERVWVLGEDVARGGLWGQYKDFLGEFGEQRVVSTPISESTTRANGPTVAPVRTTVFPSRIVNGRNTASCSTTTSRPT